LVISKAVTADWSSAGVSGLDFSNFFPDSGWTPLVRIFNYGGSKSTPLDPADVYVDAVDEIVNFDVSYDKAFSMLGMVDPGTWTLYATKIINGVENIVELASGNLQINMY
jgi:hypothetical protein